MLEPNPDDNLKPHGYDGFDYRASSVTSAYKSAPPLPHETPIQSPPSTNPSSRTYSTFSTTTSNLTSESSPSVSDSATNSDGTDKRTGKVLGSTPAYVYLLRDACLWIPDFLLNCCFRKAHLQGCDASYVRVPKAKSKGKKSTKEGELALNMSEEAETEDEDASDEEGEQEDAVQVDEFRVFKLIFLIGLTTLAGVLNNIFFVSMSIKMPGYPSFLLYFTTILYVLIYFVWLVLKRRAQQQQLDAQNAALLSAVSSRAASADEEILLFAGSDAGDSTPLILAVNGRDATDYASLASVPTGATAKTDASLKTTPQSPLQAAEPPAKTIPSLLSSMQDVGWGYLAVGLLITVGGACSQFADPHVTGSMQAIINQLTLPLTAYFAHVLLKHKFSRLEVIGAAIVLASSALPLLTQLWGGPAEAMHETAAQMNKPFWVLIFLLSDIPSALVRRHSRIRLALD